LAAIFGAVWPDPALAPYSSRYKLVRQRPNRLEREIAAIDVDDRVSFSFADE
jgi:hypothetical protein